MALPSSTVNSQHLSMLQVINIVIIGIVCPSLYKGDAFHINNKKLSLMFMQMSRIIHYITAATQISTQFTFGPSGPWPPAMPFSPWSPEAPGSPLSPGLPRSPYKMAEYHLFTRQGRNLVDKILNTPQVQ